MKQLDKLNRELITLKARLQYQEFEKTDFNRIAELKTLIIAKQQEIIELLSIR
jgi:hypothetical protein